KTWTSVSKLLSWALMTSSSCAFNQRRCRLLTKTSKRWAARHCVASLLLSPVNPRRKEPWYKPGSSPVNPLNFLPNTKKEVHLMPNHTDDTVLQLVNVSKSFGPVNVIKDVTLSVRRGQVQALLGEN